MTTPSMLAVTAPQALVAVNVTFTWRAPEGADGRMLHCHSRVGPDEDVDRPADYLLSSRNLHQRDHADAGRLRVSERPFVQRERGANEHGFSTVTDAMPVVHTTGTPGGNRGGGGLSTSGARCDAYGERERALCNKSTDGASCPSLTSQSPTWCSKVRSANFGGPRREPQEGSAHRAAVDWRLCSAPITSGLQPHRPPRCMLSNEQGTDAAHFGFFDVGDHVLRFSCLLTSPRDRCALAKTSRR